MTATPDPGREAASPTSDEEAQATKATAEAEQMEQLADWGGAKPDNGGEHQAVAVCLSCGRVRRCHLRLWPGVRSLRERFALVHRVRQEGVPTWHAAHAVQHMRGKEPVRIVQGVRREYAQAARKPS